MLRGCQVVSIPSLDVCKENQLPTGWGCPKAVSPPGPAQAPTQEDEQHAHTNLQHEGNGDEDHQGDEEAEARALFDDSLQLGGVGHQQRDVQHALRCALLVGIMVHVDGPAPAPAARLWGGAVMSLPPAGSRQGCRPGPTAGPTQVSSGTGGEVGADWLAGVGSGEG